MVFSSTVFLFLFLPLTLMIYYNPIVRGRAFRNFWLFLASVGFYAWGEPVFVFIMLLSIAVTWALGRAIAAGRAARGWLAVGVLWHVGLLFVFKYLSFICRELAPLIGNAPGADIALPIGISFFTFQMMSYLFDVRRGDAGAARGPLEVGLYAALFPQLIAGPIVRWRDIASQIATRRETFGEFAAGMERFAFGLGKKVLLANYLAYIADGVFDAAGPRSLCLAWFGAAAYTLQIYFDFSGYSDMAIGLGRMFGFRFAENFDRPYQSRSVTEFWRRWHISLSSWFRDYVYIPLGGGRGTGSERARNLFAVWMLTGIWHGANWTFVAWGLFYFVLLSAERAAGVRPGAEMTTGRAALGRVYTLAAVACAWVIFRSPSLGAAWAYLGEMFGLGAGGVTGADFASALSRGWIVMAAAAAICALPPGRSLDGRSLDGHSLDRRSPDGCSRAGRSPAGQSLPALPRAVAAAIVFSLSVMQVISSAYDPFIYFNF